MDTILCLNILRKGHPSIKAKISFPNVERFSKSLFAPCKCPLFSKSVVEGIIILLSLEAHILFFFGYYSIIINKLNNKINYNI